MRLSYVSQGSGNHKTSDASHLVERNMERKQRMLEADVDLLLTHEASNLLSFV